MAGCVVLAEIDWGFAVSVFLLVTAWMMTAGAVGATLAEAKGRDALAGALLGALFGPSGWLLIVLLGRKRP